MCPPDPTPVDRWGCRDRNPPSEVWRPRRRAPANPRRPAWEDGCKLETKNIAFLGTSFWRLRVPRFHPMLSSRLKRRANGAHETALTLPVRCRSDEALVGIGGRDFEVAFRWRMAGIAMPSFRTPPFPSTTPSRPEPPARRRKSWASVLVETPNCIVDFRIAVPMSRTIQPDRALRDIRFASSPDAYERIQSGSPSAARGTPPGWGRGGLPKPLSRAGRNSLAGGFQGRRAPGRFARDQCGAQQHRLRPRGRSLGFNHAQCQFRRPLSDAG